MHASTSQLALVLLLIGWKGGANLLSQSHRVESAKPITFQHSNENRSNWNTNQTKHYLGALEKTSYTCTIMNSTQHNINFNNRGKKTTENFFSNYLCIFFSWLWSRQTSSETFFSPSIAFTKSASAFWSLFFNSGTSSCNDWISLWRKREVYEYRQVVTEVKLLK